MKLSSLYQARESSDNPIHRRGLPHLGRGHAKPILGGFPPHGSLLPGTSLLQLCVRAPCAISLRLCQLFSEGQPIAALPNVPGQGRAHRRNVSNWGNVRLLPTTATVFFRSSFVGNVLSRFFLAHSIIGVRHGQEGRPTKSPFAGKTQKRLWHPFPFLPGRSCASFRRHF